MDQKTFMSALRLILLFLAAMELAQPAFAERVICHDECAKLGQPDRRAQLACEAECEKKNPDSFSFCQEFTPCLLACEVKLPEESLTARTREEKTKCNGVCFNRYLKLGCNPYAPPQEGGGGGGGGQPANRPEAQKSFPLPSQEEELKIIPKKEAEAPSDSANSLDAQGSQRFEEAGLPGLGLAPANLDPDNPQAGAEGKLNPVGGGNLPAKGDSSEFSPLAQVVRETLRGEEDLTLFEKVSRKYREKAHALRIQN